MYMNNLSKTLGVGTMRRLGNQGAVFSVNGKVLKIVPHPQGKREYNFQNTAHKAKLSPAVYRLVQNFNIPQNVYRKFINNNSNVNTRLKNVNGGRPVRVGKFNAFIMNNLHANKNAKTYSGGDFFQNASVSRANKQMVFEKILRKLKKLHTAGIEHGDFHPMNFYVIVKDGKFKIKIIDFGRSVVRPPNKSTNNLKAGYFGNNVTTNYDPGRHRGYPLFQKNKGPVMYANNNSMNLILRTLKQHGVI
jgi:serine/threonine protein kinase